MELQAQNQVYNAFKEAGLEKEARQLSETIKDNNGNIKVVPALGHYIALLDNILDTNNHKNPDNSGITYSLYVKSKYFITGFFNSENFYKKGAELIFNGLLNNNRLENFESKVKFLLENGSK